MNATLTTATVSTSNATREDAYAFGRSHYHAGIRENPFKGAKEAEQCWWDGYLDARTARRLAKVFARYGVSYP